jgi:hypothetical protein
MGIAAQIDSIAAKKCCCFSSQLEKGQENMNPQRKHGGKAHRHLTLHYASNYFKRRAENPTHQERQRGLLGLHVTGAAVTNNFLKYAKINNLHSFDDM